MSDAVAIAGPSGWPGEDAYAAHLAALDVLADPPSGVAGVPGLLALPNRGPWAQPAGRALALAESMPASLEPHGWRLALVPGADQQLARRYLRADVEALALASAGWQGPVTLPVLGPFSLAAVLWLPVGERVVGDAVALADLVSSLALGIERHVAEVSAAREVVAGSDDPGAGAEVVLHEPFMPAILAGSVPSFSGMSRLRAIAPEVVADTLTRGFAALPGTRVVVQVVPDPDVISAVGAARPFALQLDTARLDARGWDALAEQVEAGVQVRHAVVPHARADERADPGAVARSVLEPWRATGLTTAEQPVVVLPRPGLSEVTPGAAAATLRATARAALSLGELLAS